MSQRKPEVSQGDTAEILVKVETPAGVPVSLAGATIVWKLALDAEAPALMIKTIGNGLEVLATADGNQFEIKLSAAETAELAPQDYFHQARVSFPDGKVHTVFRQYLSILDTLE